MLVPTHIVALRHLRRFTGRIVLVLLMAAPIFAREPQPTLHIPLAPLGFQTLTPEFLQAGSSMLTLDFIDDQHILLTFNARTLLKRIPGDPPTDQDRNVAALLIELPSGHVLARTQWRFHDRGRYLWNLGHGRFLLRTRNTLTTFAPLANLATPEPFRERPLISVIDREIGVLLLTSDGDLLTVETRLPAPPAAEPQTPLFGPTPPRQTASDSPSFGHSSDPDPVQINFYRIAIPDGAGDEVIVQSAGAGRSRSFGNIELTAAGYLDILDQPHQSWAFNFNTFAGKIMELAAFDSTCRPSPRFISHSEFIAFACRSGQTPNAIGGFNMRGEEMWEQGLYGSFFAPFLVTSPSSGRFALGRVMLGSEVIPGQAVDPEQMTAQNVVVYQTDSGKQLLKVECSPIERAGQNFALSPSGLNFGVIANSAIEIYSLPALTKKELADVKLADASAPPATGLPVQLATETPSQPESSADQHSAATQATTPPINAPATPPAPAVSAEAKAPATSTPADTATNPSAGAAPTTPPESAGDAQPGESNEPRKPPTLYTLPTDPPNDQPR